MKQLDVDDLFMTAVDEWLLTASLLERLPPTNKQLQRLFRLGHVGPLPATRAAASRLIHRRKFEREEVANA